MMMVIASTVCTQFCLSDLCLLTHLISSVFNQVWWFTPVMPALWEWETEVGGSQDQEFETSLANTVKPHLYQKYKSKLGMVGATCSLSYLGG